MFSNVFHILQWHSDLWTCLEVAHPCQVGVNVPIPVPWLPWAVEGVDGRVRLPQINPNHLVRRPLGIFRIDFLEDSFTLFQRGPGRSVDFWGSIHGVSIHSSIPQVPLPMFSFTGNKKSILGDLNFYGKASDVEKGCWLQCPADFGGKNPCLMLLLWDTGSRMFKVTLDWSDWNISVVNPLHVNIWLKYYILCQFMP